MLTLVLYTIVAPRSTRGCRLGESFCLLPHKLEIRASFHMPRPGLSPFGMPASVPYCSSNLWTHDCLLALPARCLLQFCMPRGVVVNGMPAPVPLSHVRDPESYNVPQGVVAKHHDTCPNTWGVVFRLIALTQVTLRHKPSLNSDLNRLRHCSPSLCVQFFILFQIISFSSSSIVVMAWSLLRCPIMICRIFLT